MGRFNIAVGVIALVFAVSLTASAHTFSCPYSCSRSVCTAQNDQLRPKIISDGAGGGIVTWQDDRDGGRDIYAQRLYPSCGIMWPLDGVPICRAINEQGYPDITPDGVGGAIIAWDDLRSATHSEVYLQRVNASGNTLWPVDGVSVCTLTCSQNYPQVVSDGAGGAIVAWENNCRGDTVDVYAQRISSSGSRMWGDCGRAICTAVGVPHWHPMLEIIPDGSGGAIIAWDDYRNASTPYDCDVYAQRINSSGNVMWQLDGIPICVYSAMQGGAELIQDGSGGAIIVWNDQRGAFDVYAQRVNASGEKLWLQYGECGVPVCNAYGHQYHPEIATDGASGAIITWYDIRDGTQSDVYAQRLDASGNPLWTENGAPVCVAAGNQGEVDIVSDGVGGAWITWLDDRSSSPDTTDIYAQRVSASGDTLCSGAVQVCKCPGVQRGGSGHCPPPIVSDGTGGTIIVWEDHRDSTVTGIDIYAQPVRSDCLIGVEESELLPSVSALSQGIPNPFHPSCTIQYDLPTAQRVTLRVFDVTGTVVRTLVNARQEAGPHRELWDGKDDAGKQLPSGVYFYRLEAGDFVATRKMVLLH